MENFLDNFYNLLEDTDKSEIKAETSFKDLDEWDSMLTLMLIAMVDENYGKQISGDVINKADTLSDLYTEINK